ncbi:MotA/TolQ/ExbB proton channel family protein [Agaribacter flavus]|uniref:MotA/TolQ/ExbB proton channel family protein n=1 Tax=Agaribacter flavus TaxID=1902781 RepID=A0ABV7FRD9_9ALTE
MKNNANMNPSPLVSMVVFIAIIALVHLFYQGIVRPSAAAAVLSEGSGATTNLWVIFKDFEQQACVSIGLFCAFLIIYKYQRIVFKEEPLFTMDYLANYDKSAQLDVSDALSSLESSAYAQNSSMQTWINCLQRFKNTQNVQHAADAISDSVDTLAAQLESGNSMIRYIIWAIPSIGFIGTVRGIGSALAKAEEAVAGDISGMVDKLGVAFNSTLVSLIISIILMYILYVLNNRQDEMVINTRKNCEKHLLTHLHQ